MTVCKEISMAIEVERRRFLLAELLRKHMAERNLSQRQLARSLGLNPTSVGAYLDMSAWPGPDNRDNIAEVLGWSRLELDAYLEERPLQSSRPLEQLKADLRALSEAEFPEIFELVVGIAAQRLANRDSG